MNILRSVRTVSLKFESKTPTYFTSWKRSNKRSILKCWQKSGFWLSIAVVYRFFMAKPQPFLKNVQPGWFFRIFEIPNLCKRFRHGLVQVELLLLSVVDPQSFQQRSFFQILLSVNCTWNDRWRYRRKVYS